MIWYGVWMFGFLVSLMVAVKLYDFVPSNLSIILFLGISLATGVEMIFHKIRELKEILEKEDEKKMEKKNE